MEQCIAVHLTSRPSRFTEHLLENYASMHNLHFFRLLSEGLTRFPLDSRNFSPWGSTAVETSLDKGPDEPL